MVARPLTHEVLDQQLAAALEQLAQAARAVDGVEDVVGVHAHPGQGAALGGEAVLPGGEVLLVGEQVLAVGDPAVAGHDGVSGGGGHRCSLG